MKIEPHENGPLFVEMNFYLRTAKPEMVEEFRKEKSLKSFGMPILRGSGNHTLNGQKYRFLVMDRYSKDIDKIFHGGKQVFSQRNAFNLTIKVLDILEYIHSKGYLHNDIKAQNMLLGYGGSKENDVYLVDFGLVSKYHRGEDKQHIDYKPDPRFAHDGTIEYLSRDAHIGTKARRSDLEILGYNLIHWLSGHLPWIDNLTNPKTVQAKKEDFMNNLSVQLRQCFGNAKYPDVLKEFMNYVISLEFKDKPNYDKCRSMFQKALSNEGNPLDGKLDFTVKSSPAKTVKKSPIKRKSSGPKAITKSPNKKVRTSNKKEKISRSNESSDEFITDDSEDENKSTNAATNKVLDAKSRSKRPVVKSPLSKEQRMSGLSLNGKRPTYKESASQTSPNFVRIAKAAAKAKKAAALSTNSEMEQFVAKAKKAAINAKMGASTNAKKTPNSKDRESNILKDNPTPAMLELIRKKEAANLEKASAKKRKTVLSKVSRTSPGGSKKSKT